MTTGLQPYPEYKDSGLPWLGQVPAHWEIRRAKYLFRRVDIRSTSGEEELLTVSSKRGVVPRSSIKVTMFKAESYIGHKLCWPGDLVINSLWAWARGLGVSKHHGLISSAYGVYRLRNGFEQYADFIHHLVRSAAFHWELHVRSKGVWTSRLQLTDDDFLDAPIPLPPATEAATMLLFINVIERRISRFIHNRRRLIGVLNEQKQAIINRAVTRGLDPNVQLKPSGIDWLGDIPERWEVKRLKFIVGINYGISPHNSTYNTDGNGVLLVNGPDEYSRQDFGYTRAIKWTTAPVKFAPKGALLFCLRGSTTGRLNICHDDVSIGRGVAALVPHGNERYFAYVMMALRGHLRVTFRGSTFPSVKSAQLNNYWLPDPPPEEQEPIADFIDAKTKLLNDAIDKAQREIELIREYRTRLIADVVTGKVDVRHLAPPLEAMAAEAAGEDLDEDLDDEMPGEDDLELAEEATDADD